MWLSFAENIAHDPNEGRRCFRQKRKDQKSSMMGEIWQKNRRTKIERRATAKMRARTQILGGCTEIVTSRSRNVIVLPSLIRLNPQSHGLVRGKSDDPNS